MENLNPRLTAITRKPILLTLVLISGLALCLHVDGHLILYLRNYWDAALRKSRHGPRLLHRETQQLPTHLPESFMFV